MKALLYCTKAKPYLIARPHLATKELVIETKDDNKYKEIALNGFIVAECEIDKVEEIDGLDILMLEDLRAFTYKTCLTSKQLRDYSKGNDLYYLHLSNVKVFDKPKKLAYHTLDNSAEFYTKKWDKKFKTWRIGSLIKAPQNMCNIYDRFCNHYILISIRPEWLCKILNGEKTIEVRKQILNCLKEVSKDE